MAEGVILGIAVWYGSGSTIVTENVLHQLNDGAGHDVSVRAMNVVTSASKHQHSRIAQQKCKSLYFHAPAMPLNDSSNILCIRLCQTFAKRFCQTAKQFDRKHSSHSLAAKTSATRL